LPAPGKSFCRIEATGVTDEPEQFPLCSLHAFPTLFPIGCTASCVTLNRRHFYSDKKALLKEGALFLLALPCRFPPTGFIYNKFQVDSEKREKKFQKDVTWRVLEDYAI